MFSFIKEAYKAISSSEKKMLRWSITAILFLSFLPFGYAFFNAWQNGLTYTGYSSIAGADKMVYFSQIEEAREGNLLFHNLFTSESGQARIFSPVWLALGWAAFISGFSNVVIFHLFRLILAAAFLLLIYLLISRLCQSRLLRQYGFWAIAIGSGFGLFTFNAPFTFDNIFETFGTDIWVSEGNTFLTLYHSPLFILSQILMIVFFWWLVERLKQASLVESFKAGLLLLFLGIFHPYDLVIVYTVTAVWFAVMSFKDRKIDWRNFYKLFWIFSLSLISIIYFFWLKSADASFAVWTVQNVTVSPRILNYFLGFGLFFIFYLIGLYPSWKSKDRFWNFLAVWSVAGWFLIYFPLQFQRRLINGLHLAVGLIAILGLSKLVEHFNKRPKIKALFSRYVIRNAAIMVIFLLLLLTNLYNLVMDLEYFGIKKAPFYLNQEQRQSLAWLRKNMQDGDAILASARMGNLIPAYTAKKVYIGHGHQTGNWQEKFTLVEQWFFKGNKDDADKQAWLKDQKIDYVYHGDLEKGLGSFSPSEKDYLTLVLDLENVKIYKVND